MCIFYYVALWHFFKKAGYKGWEAIIPLYNTWVFVEISGLAWWYAFVAILLHFVRLTSALLNVLVFIVSFTIHFFTCYNISKKLHCDTDFAILMVLFPFVMIPIVAFSDKYQFDNNVLVSENGPIERNCNDWARNQYNNFTNSNNNDEKENINQKRFCIYCGNLLKDKDNYCGKCGKERK